MLTLRRLPRDVPDTVEAKQAELRTQPEITVGRLGNRDDLAFGKAVAELPRRVRVLVNVQRRIQRERGRAPRQQDASQHGAGRDGVSSSSDCFLHAAHILPYCRFSRYGHPEVGLARQMIYLATGATGITLSGD